MDYFRKPKPRELSPAGHHVLELAEKVVPLVDKANGTSWYKRYDNEVDVAAVGLCRLRRAAAGLGGGPESGDEAVRTALGQADPEAAQWLASRLISFIDEQGYPETLAPWLAHVEDLKLDLDQ